MGQEFFLGNRVEALYEELIQGLYGQGAHPLSPRYVVVPSQAMKSWLTLRMARDPRLGIATGVELLLLHQLPDFLAAAPRSLPNLQALALEISWQIQALTDLPRHWEQLFSFLKWKGGAWSSQSLRRLQSLSEELASNFLLYETYGGQWLNDWEKKVDSCWQADLWNRVFSDQGPWQPASKILSSIAKPRSLHLFALSFLPQLYREVLSQWADQEKVSYYVLSPCLAFWTDSRSNFESRAMLRAWREKGESVAKQEALEDFLRDSNPLLANFGRMGRDLASHMEEATDEAQARYQIPDSAWGVEAYQELIFTEHSPPPYIPSLSLLEGVQSDLLLLRNPQEQAPISVDEKDRSITVHACPSRVREIQVVQNAVRELLEEGFQPADILVMAPDINPYASLIQALFETEDQPVDYQILDLEPNTHSSIVQAFLTLLDLVEKRWERDDVLRLLKLDVFCQRHGFDEETCELIEQALMESKQYWGFDARHREQILEPCGVEKAEEEGSLEWAISKLLLPLALEGESTTNLDLIEGEALGKFALLLRSLFEDLQPFRGGIQMTVAQWAGYFQDLYESYLGENHPRSRDERSFFQRLSQFKSLLQGHSERLFDGPSILPAFRRLLSEEKVHLREDHLQSVRFCSLLPMRAIPAKVIFLIGLNDGEFPRTSPKNSLNLMGEGSHYCPSRVDFDRYLFLESLLSCRSRLLLSYQNRSDQDNQAQVPSLLIRELLSYLDQAFTFAGKKPSECILEAHSVQSYHSQCFTEEKKKGASSRAYRLAKIIQGKERGRPKFLSSCENFFKTEETASLIDLWDLRLALRNPLRLFFSRSLGLRSLCQNDLVEDEEPLRLDPLSLFQLREQALQKSPEEVLEIAQTRSLLPPGRFRAAALATLKEEVALVQKGLEAHHLSGEELFALHLSEGFREKQERGEGCFTPPLIHSTAGTEIILKGKISPVCSRGLLLHSKRSFPDLLKIWPDLLFMDLAIKKFNLSIEPQVLLTKQKGKVFSSAPCSAENLDKLISFYRTCLGRPCPINPAGMEAILEGREDKFVKALLGQGTSFVDPYRLSYQKMKDCKSPGEIYLEWKDEVQGAFGELYGYFRGSK